MVSVWLLSSKSVTFLKVIFSVLITLRKKIARSSLKCDELMLDTERVIIRIMLKGSVNGDIKVKLCIFGGH